MKLLDLAKQAIKLIIDAGEEGINNIELATKLEMHRRRVYDIIAILKASNFIETRREKGGTRILYRFIFSGSNSGLNSESSTKLLQEKLSMEIEQRKKFEKEILELKKEIKILKNSLLERGHTNTSSITKFATNRIIIRTKSPSEKIKRVQSSGYQVLVEVETPGLIVEPVKLKS